MQTLQFYGEKLPDFSQLKDAFYDIRAETVNAVGVKLLKLVLDEIEPSGVDDAHGKIQSWQNKYIGSGKGYAAVRATTDAPGYDATGANSPGAITNYLESGHRTRRPSGRAKRYEPRVMKSRTTAFHFYAASEKKVQPILENAARDMENKLVKAVERL